MKKKQLEISSFYTSAPKIMIICCSVPEIWCVTDIIIFHFELFFALLPPNSPKKYKFWQNEKNTWWYHHFMYVYQKLWSDDICFLRYGAWQKDGQKMWHIEVGVLPKNLKAFLEYDIQHNLYRLITMGDSCSTTTECNKVSYAQSI